MTAPQAQRRTGGAIAMFVIGSLLVLLGIGPFVGGIAIAALAAQQSGGEFIASPEVRLSTEGYAITAPELRVRTSLRQVPDGVIDLRLEARSERGDDLFIGIGPQRDVDDYLDDVARSELVGGRGMQQRGMDFRDIPGSREPGEPAEEDFWLASESGSGSVQLDLPLRSGDWVIVVMNDDASSDVDVAVGVGARSDLFVPLAVTLLIIGGAMLLGGLALIVFGASGLGRSGVGVGGPTPPPGAAAPAASAAPGVEGTPTGLQEDRQSPLTFTGRLSPEVSRALWLVKWILVIPHVFVLIFLWLATWATSIVAWFAILFTGRYPRSLFAFNVGVLRWSWRVSFYGYSALGTDEYPPFTLQPSNYPAELTVAYPERLSRGLVLVKSWLLAIPHLLIVAALTTGASWAYRDDAITESRVASPSLLALLVVVAAVILLFTGRYQRPLFALIMGVNRWVYRVLVYVLLMRDEYPPFRLDQGAEERTIALRPA